MHGFGKICLAQILFLGAICADKVLIMQEMIMICEVLLTDSDSLPVSGTAPDYASGTASPHLSK